MRLLVIILLLIVLWALIYMRLRPYIVMARRVLGIMKDARGVSNTDAARPAQSNASDGQRLMRCETCNTWIPVSRAIRLRSQAAVYCSDECLESAATEFENKRAAGGKL